MRRPPKIKKGRCVICGKYWVAEMVEFGGKVAIDPCPYCNIRPCVMDFLDDYVIGTSAMKTEEALVYATTLETQNECELAIKEEIFGRKKKARTQVLEAVMFQYDVLDEAGVTDRGSPRLTAEELIEHYLVEEEEEEPVELTPKQRVTQWLEEMTEEYGSVKLVIEAVIERFVKGQEKEGEDNDGTQP